MYFTDKQAFSSDLSVKQGPKHLNFYGQTAIFDHFIRNRHFWSRPFTDRRPIFADLSVNGSDFAKCSAAHHLFSHCTWLRLRSKRWFLRFSRNLRPHCFGEGNRVEHFSDFGGFCSTFEAARAGFEESGRQKRVISPVFCLLWVPRALDLELSAEKALFLSASAVAVSRFGRKLWKIQCVNDDRCFEVALFGAMLCIFQG